MNEKSKVPEENKVLPDETTDITLPFSNPRTDLKNAFVHNAVPREAQYQQWLTEHYDMANSLGLEKGSTAGDGLALNPTTKKIEVKVNSLGGIVSEESGVKLKLLATTGNYSSYYAAALKSNENGMFINIGSTGSERKGLKGYADMGEFGIGLGLDIDDSLQFNTSGKVGIKANVTSGITVDTSGAKIKLVNSNSNTESYAGALKVNADGLFINVGAGTSRKGLKGYPNMGSNQFGLGVDHDNTLSINNNGQLGVTVSTAVAEVKNMARIYGAAYYFYNPFWHGYVESAGTNGGQYIWVAKCFCNFKSGSDGKMAWFLDADYLSVKIDNKAGMTGAGNVYSTGAFIAQVFQLSKSDLNNLSISVVGSNGGISTALLIV